MNNHQHNNTASKHFSPSSTTTIATTSTTLTSSSTTTIRRQSGTVKEIVEVIPSSNTIDSAMYERDKQIYKCSTMRQGGKFDPKFKPSILNCPLPEIPKSDNDEESCRNSDHGSSSGTGHTRTYQRNIKMPGLKPIQPPKIGNSLVNNNISNSNNCSNDSNNIPILSTAPNNLTNTNTLTAVSNTTNNNNTNIMSSNANLQNPSGNVPLNPNDESNYAVTEL